jgi:hypothetical protein
VKSFVRWNETVPCSVFTSRRFKFGCCKLALLKQCAQRPHHACQGAAAMAERRTLSLFCHPRHKTDAENGPRSASSRKGGRSNEPAPYRARAALY